MNKAIWPALRELIQAEARLAVLRDRSHDRLGCIYRENERKEIKQLCEQITRMETAVREALPD